VTPAKVRPVLASMRRPGTNVGEPCNEPGITRQTLYRHVGPAGEWCADGVKLLTTARNP
jgi:hypothetical protein